MGETLSKPRQSAVRNAAGAVFKSVSALFFLLAGAATAQELDGKDFPKLLLERECLDCDFSGLPLQRQPLLGIVAQRGNFTGANLSGADLRRADLRGAILRDVNFTGANLSSARWDAADLSGAIFCNTILPDRSVSTDECIEGTWQSSFDGLTGGVLTIRPTKKGYWEAAAGDEVSMRDIHRVGDGKYNAEIYLELGDDSYKQVGWFPIGCKLNADGLVCGKSGIIAFKQISSSYTIPNAAQFKLPDKPVYSIWVYALEFNRDWGDSTIDKYLLRKHRIFSGTREQLNFNTAYISGHLQWRHFSERGDAWGQPVRAALYKGTKKNPFAQFVRKTEVETDTRGRFEIYLRVQNNGDVEEKDFLAIYMSRKRIYQGPGETAYAPLNSGNDFTAVNILTNFESRRSDFLNWFTSEDHKQWMKNNKVGRQDINALNSLIRYATAPATGSAELVEKAAKLYEKIAGKPLPGVTKADPDAQARQAAVRALFWDSIKRFHAAQDSKAFQ